MFKNLPNRSNRTNDGKATKSNYQFKCEFKTDVTPKACTKRNEDPCTFKSP